MIKYLIFIFICLLHIFIWGFILFAFISKNTAKFNLVVVIPIIYILHILPFHILKSIKYLLYPDSATNKVDSINIFLIIPKLFTSLQSTLDNICFKSPISSQGMLIFGALSSAYRLLYT